jgi:hypothetical protein
MAGLIWKPPATLDHRKYREILALIKAEKERDPIRAMAWFAAVAESDFWFWQKYVMPLGSLPIQDKHHKRYGKLLVDEPWYFDRMREIQDNFDNRRSNVLYRWFRGGFKSTSIVQGGVLWILAKNHPSACDCGACPPSDTIAIFTHKIEKVGEAMGGKIKSQIAKNEILRAHWPQFRLATKLSDTAIILDRKEGPHEPSVSVHPITGSSAGGHYTWIFGDDCVTEEIDRSPELARKVDDQISYMQMLRKDNTVYVWVGTPYPYNDPIHARAVKGGFFSRISHFPGILPGNIPQLFSLQHFQDIARTTEDQIFQAQIMLRLVPKGGAYFRVEWLPRWRGRAEEAAKGARIHFIIDMAGAGKKSDYSTLRVVACFHDKRRRNLDLWREKIGLTDMADLLFGCPMGDEVLAENHWKPTGGLVTQWARIDPDLTVWVEEVGASGHAETFRRELAYRRKMGMRTPLVYIRGLTSNMQKESRIARLQPEYRQGMIEYPEGAPETRWKPGFGHGSATSGDDRDTLQQFVEDEYKHWTVNGETAYDDMLDTEAWFALPNAVFAYGDSDSSQPDSLGSEFERRLADKRSGREGNPSWRVS